MFYNSIISLNMRVEIRNTIGCLACMFAIMAFSLIAMVFHAHAQSPVPTLTRRLE